MTQKIFKKLEELEKRVKDLEERHGCVDNEGMDTILIESCPQYAATGQTCRVQTASKFMWCTSCTEAAERGLPGGYEEE